MYASIHPQMSKNFGSQLRHMRRPHKGLTDPYVFWA